jgi:hypothetical protein
LIPHTTKEIRKTYEQQKTIRKTAEVLGISRSTVKRRLHGTPKPRGRPPVPLAMKKSWHTKAYEWFMDHQTEPPLPHSPTEIAKLSGFKVYQISYILKLRKQIFSEKLSQLPNLRNLDLILVDTLGRQFSTRAVTSYTFNKPSPYDGSVTMWCLTGGVKLQTVKTTVGELEEKIATLLRTED